MHRFTFFKWENSYFNLSFCEAVFWWGFFLKMDCKKKNRCASFHFFKWENSCFNLSFCEAVFWRVFLKLDLIVRRRTAVHRFTFSNEKIDKSKSAVAIFFFSSSWLFLCVSCFSCEEKNVLYDFENWCYFWPVYFKVTRLKFVFLPVCS